MLFFFESWWAEALSDPVLGALRGGGSGGDSGVGSSAGVKGCVAREAYVRAVQDLARVQEVSGQTCSCILRRMGAHFASMWSGRVPVCFHVFGSLDGSFPIAERRDVGCPVTHDVFRGAS